MNISQIALRNIFRNKRRSLLSLSAITIVTFAITFMFSFIEGMKYDQQTTSQKFITGQVRVRNAGFEEYQFTYPEEFMIKDYQAVLKALGNVPGITDHSGRMQIRGQTAAQWETINQGTPDEMNMFTETISTLVIGLDFANDTEYFSIKPYIKDGGRLPGEGEALVADGFAQTAGLKSGDDFFLFAGNDSRRLKVAGLVSLPVIQLGQKAVYLPLSTVQDLLARYGEAQEVLIQFTPGTDLAASITQTRDTLHQTGLSGLEIKAWNEIGYIGTYIELASTMFNFMALFFFVIGTTVIVNTTMMVIYERMREIGTLRAMGMTGKEMIRLFFMEAFFLSAAGALIGVLFGVALILPLNVSGLDLGQMADVSKMDISISNVIYPQINLYSTLFVFVYSVTVASLISFIPTRRAAKIEPVEALRAI
jgi:putative ABC transport system permease protein